jgi:CMP-N,N'-diacetyllegionaminic acid synthase
MNDVIAIIPARSGAKTVTDKNIKLLSDHPLLAYSIAAAKLSKSIDRVIVSTNSKKYADIAKYYGAETPFMRPDKYSNDTSMDRDFLLHAMEWLKANENIVPNYWVHLRPTTPLRDFRVIDSAIELIKNHQDSTSLRSAHEAPETPFKWFKKSGDNFKGIFNDDTNLPKEAFDKVYIPNGYVDIVKATYVMSNPGIHGDSMIGFVSPVCSEVDSIEEFDYIQYQINRDGTELQNYLNSF